MGDRVFGDRRSSVEFCWTKTIAIAAQEQMVTIRCDKLPVCHLSLHLPSQWGFYALLYSVA
jgi:hypothetical protein